MRIDRFSTPTGIIGLQHDEGIVKGPGESGNITDLKDVNLPVQCLVRHYDPDAIAANLFHMGGPLIDEGHFVTCPNEIYT